MTLEWWFAYLLTSIILSLSPGSGAINTMTTSLNHGYRGAVASIAGLQTGLAIHIVLVGVGLGTLFSRSVIAFEVLKWAGAAYLIWLGIQQWRAVTLAHILVNTQAGKPDYPKAISLLENASEDLENDSAVDAQMLLGLIYANGVGIKADDDKATWYFKRSSAISRTGYSEYWAGMMFLNGEEGFIEKNKQKALHWLNLSCMEGFDTGCEEFEKLTNG